MSFFHRALLYVTRKRGKSLLLFLLLLVVASLALSGVAIRDATVTAQLNVRQALGGVFTLQQNAGDPAKWVSTQVGQYGSSSYYGGAPLTVDLAEYILGHVEGVSGYNATYTSYVVPVGRSGKALDLIESEDDGSGLNSLLASYGDFNQTVAAYASTNTVYDSYFAGGYLALVAGRPLTTSDPNAVLISKALAERNGLSVGDSITLRMSEMKASMMGYDSADTCIEVEIIGLFQATAKSTATLSNWSMDNSLFTTLDVIRAVRPDMGDEGYEKISFYVNDLAQLASIVASVKALPELNPAGFIVSADQSGVDAVMEPLANMNSLVSMLIILILAIGGAILYLVLASRMKERVHESGVLLSLGLTKRSIVAQYITEVMLIAVVAFACSIMTSSLLAQTVGSRLLNYSLTSTEQAEAAPSAQIGDAIFSTSSDYAPRFEGNRLTDIHVIIRPGAALRILGVGLMILCASVLLAALPVLRMKPREILSIMN